LLSAEESYDITIHVKGMVCDFCARSVEKTFGSTKVVESINVDLDNGVIELKLKEGETLTDEKIKKLIKANGYALESIERTE
jgi:copper chaperone CopZ